MQQTEYDTIDIRGTQLAYRRRGSGQPLVLVHPNISDMRSWEPIEDQLAQHFSVINYSPRYHWPNQPIADDQNDPWEVHAEDLAALLETLDAAPAHILGNSSGATIGLLLARDRPEMVKSLLLEEPAAVTIFLPHVPPTAIDVLKLLFRHPWYFFPVVLFGATVVGPVTSEFKAGHDETGLQLFVRGVLGEKSFSRLSDERIRQARQNLAPHAALFRGVGLPCFTEEHARHNITCPTLLLTGSDTCSAHAVMNRHLATLIPGAKEVVVPHASHLVHEDNPQAVLDAIRVFLAGGWNDTRAEERGEVGITASGPSV